MTRVQKRAPKAPKAKWTERIAISVPEVAELLSIGRNLAYSAVAEGKIPVIEIGGRKVVPTAWVKKQAGLEGTQ